jgi:hypothetical protein
MRFATISASVLSQLRRQARAKAFKKQQDVLEKARKHSRDAQRDFLQKVSRV